VLAFAELPEPEFPEPLLPDEPLEPELEPPEPPLLEPALEPVLPEPELPPLEVELPAPPELVVFAELLTRELTPHEVIRNDAEITAMRTFPR
jgi:hypothetical protein